MVLVKEEWQLRMQMKEEDEVDLVKKDRGKKCAKVQSKM